MYKCFKCFRKMFNIFLVFYGIWTAFLSCIEMLAACTRGAACKGYCVGNSYDVFGGKLDKSDEMIVCCATFSRKLTYRFRRITEIERDYARLSRLACTIVSGQFEKCLSIAFCFRWLYDRLCSVTVLIVHGPQSTRTVSCPFGNIRPFTCMPRLQAKTAKNPVKRPIKTYGKSPIENTIN